MSDALDTVKEMGTQSANTFIALVKGNPVASIAIGSVVVILLILCVYLKRRCSTDAVLMSKSQLKAILRKSTQGEDSAGISRPSTRNSSRNAIVLQQEQKRIRKKPESHQRRFVKDFKRRGQRDANHHQHQTCDDAEKPLKWFPISMNISYDTEISNSSSSDIDIENNIQECVEVTIVDDGRFNNSHYLAKETKLPPELRSSSHTSRKSLQRIGDVWQRKQDKNNRRHKRWFRS